MNLIKIMETRHSVYGLNKELPVFDDKIIETVRDCVRLVPDAFNMESQRVVVVFGKKHDAFWDAVYDTMVATTGGNFSRDRTDSFAAGAGTILYFYDSAVVEETRRKFPLYAAGFHDWVMQSNGMLQFAVWNSLAEMGVGANLQHYNPVIDKMVHEMFDLPDSWVLVAQMPFGGIAKAPEQKPHQDVALRIKIEK